MRSALADLVKSTIIYEYNLPCKSRKIGKCLTSSDPDDCYRSGDNNDLEKIIYNSILEYSYGEFDLVRGHNFNMFSHAFESKFRYNLKGSAEAKQRFGIYGEALLYAILHIIYSKSPLISRGYLYNPLEKSEAKGYDAYHLLETDENIELWFGEVKFYEQYKPAIDKIFENIDKTLSDSYLNTNLLAINNSRNNINFREGKVAKILKDWDKGLIVSLIDEIKKHDIKLVYPILLMYEQDKSGYDKSIENVVKYINDEYSTVKFNNLSIRFSVFFIFLPLKEVSLIKKQVIKWIESKQPLM